MTWPFSRRKKPGKMEMFSLGLIVTGTLLFAYVTVELTDDMEDKKDMAYNYSTRNLQGMNMAGLAINSRNAMRSLSSDIDILRELEASEEIIDSKLSEKRDQSAQAVLWELKACEMTLVIDRETEGEGYRDSFDTASIDELETMFHQLDEKRAEGVTKMSAGIEFYSDEKNLLGTWKSVLVPIAVFIQLLGVAIRTPIRGT